MDFLLSSLILLITGSFSGFASGLFGVGGCFIMVPVQYWLLSSTGLDNTLAMRIAFGTGMAVTFPTVASAAYGHSRRGSVYWRAVIPMGISAVLGGLFGGTLASHLPGDILRIFFSSLVILMAIRMVFKIREYTGYDIKQGLMIHVVIGLLIGVLSGLAGIGGGIVLVPILVILLKYPMHYAIGTSSACIMFSSAGSVIAYIYNGLGVAGLPYHRYLRYLSVRLLPYIQYSIKKMSYKKTI